MIRYPRMEGRPVRESVSEYVELALPNDTNTLGTLLGGKVTHLVGLAGARRPARTPVVTASVDYTTFLHPIHVGQPVTLRSSVNRVLRTSMEVGVKVFGEDLLTGTVSQTSSAYLTFVAIDERGNRVSLPRVIPETDEGRRRYEDAGRRREERLALRNRSRK